MNGWLIVAAVWLVCYLGLYLRILPVPFMRVWFAFGLIFCILASSINGYIIDALRFIGVPRTTTQWIIALNCRFFFGMVVTWSPHIRVNFRESKINFNDVPLNSAMCCNHTSFMDVFTFVGCGPWTYVSYCKTLMKASLRKIPIFGGIFDRVGHFPVYFKSGADNDFSVDKEKQDAVMARVKKHIERGWPLAIFPEGVVNSNPRQLRPFRRGSFALMIEYKMPVYAFVAVGNADVWPSTAPVGGFPADVYCSVLKFELDYDKMDVIAVTDYLQKAVQDEVDRLYAIRDKKIA